MRVEVVVEHDDCVGGSEVCEKREAIRTSSGIDARAKLTDANSTRCKISRSQALQSARVHREEEVR